MIPVDLAEVAQVTGATVTGAPRADRVTADVEVDSRLVQPGGLFVALRGERVDGHDHAARAIQAGAVAALTARPVEGVPCLVVPDPLAAMQELARTLYVSGLEPLTFGITGSSGKTSTKDLLATVLAQLGPTLWPPGSYNNEVGLPLTALRREVDTRFAVLEYSARGLGHIAFLRSIVQPHAATVLNIGSAHLGEFGSRENIALAKGEILEDIEGRHSSALNVLNADDRLVLGLAGRTSEQVVTFGTGPDADYRAEGVEVGDDGRAAFTLVSPQFGSAPVHLRLRGEHQVSNALAVAANVLGMGLWRSAEHVADLLSAAQPVSRWRMEVSERPDGVTVVNDAYNANPESMRAALKTLAVMGAGKRRRTVAVLGAMAELGDGASQAHFELGRHVVRLDIGQLVVIGPEAGGIHAGAVLEGSWGSESRHVPDVEAAVALLRAELRPGDVVLVKASRSAGLERVAAALLAPSLGESTA